MPDATKTKAIGDKLSNAYLYVSNNPVNETDPTGLFAEGDVPRYIPSGKYHGGYDASMELGTGVQFNKNGLQITVNTSIEKKVIGFDPNNNNKEILGDAFVIHVSAKDVDPKDIEIVQFIHRTTASSDRVQYQKGYYDPKTGQIARTREYFPSYGKNIVWLLDNAHADTVTATKDNPAVERKNGELTLYDAPSFVIPNAAESAVLESYIYVKNQLVYKIHWAAEDDAAGVRSYPKSQLWGKMTDALPNWAVKTLHSEAFSPKQWAPKQDGNLWSAAPTYPSAEFIKKYPNDYKPRPK